MDQRADKHEHHFEPRVEDFALVQGRGRFVEDAPQTIKLMESSCARRMRTHAFAQST